VRVEEILKSVYSDDFDALRKKMMVMGFYKYGALKVNIDNQAYDIINSLKVRLEHFEKTRNVEFLADAANFCMMIFMYPEKFNAFYKPTDSDNSPGITGMSINDFKNFDTNINLK
jgi:hypothetical protein